MIMKYILSSDIVASVCYVVTLKAKEIKGLSNNTGCDLALIHIHCGNNIAYFFIHLNYAEI